MDEETYEVEKEARSVQSSLHKMSIVKYLLKYITSVRDRRCFQMEMQKVFEPKSFWWKNTNEELVKSICSAI
jgi:hypothetical protein